MLAIEVFRPDEMVLIINKNRNKKKLNSMMRTQQPDNPYFKADRDSESNDTSDHEEQKEQNNF